MVFKRFKTGAGLRKRNQSIDKLNDITATATTGNKQLHKLLEVTSRVVFLGLSSLGKKELDSLKF